MDDKDELLREQMRLVAYYQTKQIDLLKEMATLLVQMQQQNTEVTQLLRGNGEDGADRRIRFVILDVFARWHSYFVAILVFVAVHYGVTGNSEYFTTMYTMIGIVACAEAVYWLVQRVITRVRAWKSRRAPQEASPTD